MVEPDKLATWANAITVGRLLLSPLMFWACLLYTSDAADDLRRG